MSRGHPSTGSGPALDRLLRLAVRLGAGQTVTVSYIIDRFRVSLATAKRDMGRLEQALPVHMEDAPNTNRNGGGMPPKALRLMPGAQLVPLLRDQAA